MVQATIPPEETTPNPRSPKRAPDPHASPFYNSLVPVYEAVWPAVAKRRIRRVLRSLEIATGTDVLEVGVGTGLSLSDYPQHAQVTGIDLSEAMLAEAEQMIDDRGWNHVSVMSMNAEQLDFPDDSFDLVTSFHTISVVSDPDRMMSEIVRVCRPGGRILIINHFRSENRWIAKIVDSAGSLTKRLGWRTDLEIDEIIDQLPLRMDRCYKTNPLSLFTVMQATCKPRA